MVLTMRFRHDKIKEKLPRAGRMPRRGSADIMKKSILKSMGAMAIAIMMTFTGACNNRGETSDSPVGKNDGAAMETVVSQKHIRRADKWKGLQDNYTVLDFDAMARRVDELIYSFADDPDYVPMDKDTFEPIGYWDIGADGTRTFGIPSYVGHYYGTLANGTVLPGTQEAVTTLASVVGSSLAGIDMSRRKGYDFVAMMKSFYNPAQGLVLNRKGAQSGASFWYDLMPQIQFARLYDMYGDLGGEMRDIVLTGARKWLDALNYFKAEDGTVSFDFLAFDMAKKEPVTNDYWIEPPHAAIAYVLYSGYSATDSAAEKEAFKKGMIFCMDELDKYPRDYSYEVIQDFSPLVAAMMNREFGTHYDVEKMLNNIFDGESDTRRDFGMVSGQWGDYCVDGMIGQDNYIFLMNAYHLGSILAPLVKYAPEYADAIGKWFLNASDHVKIFYPAYLPSDHQTHGGAFHGDPYGVLAYESVRKTYDGKTPYALSDPTVYKWGQTDYGLYGSVQVGVFASIIGRTNVEQILKLNLNATDFFAADGPEEYLYYNPYPEDKQIIFEGNGRYSLYDKLTGKYLAQGAIGNALFTVPANSSVVIAVIPDGVKVTEENGRIRAGGSEIAKRSVSVSILSPDEKYQVLEGKIELTTAATAVDGLKMTVRVGDVVVYDGGYKEKLTIDTTSLRDGRCNIVVEICAPDGRRDKSTVPVDIANRGDRVDTVFSPTPEQMLAAFSSNGSASVSANAYSSQTDDWQTLVVTLPAMTLDLDRLPRLHLDMETTGYYDIYLMCSEIGTICAGQTDSKNGIVNIDIVETANSYGGGKRHIIVGPHTATIEIRVYGEKLNGIKIKEFSIDYPRA